MGDPKKSRKKYEGPPHPWQKARIDFEKNLVKTYGIKNKKELWKMSSFRKRFASHAKKLISDDSEQGAKEKEQMIERLVRLGLIEPGSEIDDILSISLKDILDRRLETMVFKKELAHSVGQARQFIVHKHITVKGRKIKSPSYLVLRDEEDTISFSVNSSLNDETHPERIKKKAEGSKQVDSNKPVDRNRKAKSNRKGKSNKKAEVKNAKKVQLKS